MYDVEDYVSFLYWTRHSDCARDFTKNVVKKSDYEKNLRHSQAVPHLCFFLREKILMFFFIFFMNESKFGIAHQDTANWVAAPVSKNGLDIQKKSKVQERMVPYPTHHPTLPSEHSQLYTKFCDHTLSHFNTELIQNSG